MHFLCAHAMEESRCAILEKSDLKVKDQWVFSHQWLYRRGTNYALSMRNNPLDKSCGEKDFYRFIMVQVIVIS